KEIQVPISAVSTSSHSEQSSQARQSRWYCRNRWESRSAPKPTERAPGNTEGLSFVLCASRTPAGRALWDPTGTLFCRPGPNEGHKRAHVLCAPYSILILIFAHHEHNIR